MAHQLGRTELEKLAPLRGYCFGRTGLSFGRKKWLAPPQKCPKNAYGLRFRMRKKGLLAQEEAELEAETQKNITLKKVLQFLKIKHALLRSKACELGILDDKLRVI